MVKHMILFCESSREYLEIVLRRVITSCNDAPPAVVVNLFTNRIRKVLDVVRNAVVAGPTTALLPLKLRDCSK